MTRTAYPSRRGTAPVPAHLLHVPEGWMLVPAAPTQEWIENMRLKTSYPQTKLAIEMVLTTAPKYGDKK